MSAAEALDQIRELERLAGRGRPLRLLGLAIVVAAFVSLVFYLDADRRRLERRVAELDATVEQLQATLATASKIQAQRPAGDEDLGRLLAEAGQTASQLQAGVERLPDDAQAEPIRTPQGVMRLDVPPAMRIGQAYAASVVLRPSADGPPEGQAVEVRLASPDFVITPLSPALARVGPDGAQWRWTIVPRKSGTRSVSLRTTLYATTPEGRSYPLRTDHLYQAVTVQASLVQRLDGFTDLLTSWMETFTAAIGILGALLAAVWLSMRARTRRFRSAVAAAEDKL